MDYSDQDRFATLASRSVRRQLLVLAFALIAVLGISSALNSGLAASRRLDDEFLAKQFDDLAAFAPTLDLTDMRAAAAETDSSAVLAVIRRLLELGQSLIGPPGGEQTDRLSRAINTRLQEFAAHERERNDAFLIRLALPYLSEPVSINARQVADMWPPCLVVILAVVLGLGHQQRAFAIMLSDAIGQNTTQRERAKRLALAEFVPGKLVPARNGERDVVLYRGPLAIRPLSALVAGLAALVVALSVTLVLTGDPAVTRAPSSIVNLYYSPGILLVLATAVGVATSRVHYYRKAGDVIGRRVYGYWTFRFRSLFCSLSGWLDRDLGWRFTARRGLAWTCAVVAAGSMFFGWTEPATLADYSGVDFLRSQKELTRNPDARPRYVQQRLSERIAKEMAEAEAQAPATGATSDQHVIAKTPEMKAYAIPPSIFTEMRWHLYVALSFILMCALHEAIPEGAVRWLVGNVRAWLAVGVTFLGANLLLFFGVLFLQAYRSEVLHGALDMLFGVFSGQMGFPMALFQPTQAFSVFMASGLVLVLIGPFPSLPLFGLRRLFRAGT